MSPPNKDQGTLLEKHLNRTEHALLGNCFIWRKFDYVGSILGQRLCANVEPTLAHWTKRRWANVIGQRWPNVGADIGPMLGQHQLASWEQTSSAFFFIGHKNESRHAYLSQDFHVMIHAPENSRNTS